HPSLLPHFPNSHHSHHRSSLNHQSYRILQTHSQNHSPSNFHHSSTRFPLPGWCYSRSHHPHSHHQWSQAATPSRLQNPRSFQ
ncbi:hypothetical protein, partial [Pseudomonas sp. MPR-E5]|uniref:hypothetical protein n=1 Tax=Pseudomonas sp. MPR-E5 TaxID=2070595 RepID=UPI001C453479